jgi:Fe-Mn family superoxide dismutase
MKNLHTLFFLFIGLVFAKPSEAQEVFSLAPLPYAYDALEPYIDKETMNIHYSKHHQAYVTNLNKALVEQKVSNKNLVNILEHVAQYSEAIRNNAGGHYNHTLFWSILTPTLNTKPSDALLQAINKEFGSLDSLKKIMNTYASKRFGSGWVWLCVNEQKQLFVCSTPNQDNPIMNIAEKKGYPIMGIDVWEHAYYLKYQNKRGDYLNAIWNIVNWQAVSDNYQLALK